MDIENIKLPFTYTVKKGDSLQDLCNQIYNDPYCYVQVAKFNGLNKFRNLKEGSQLTFPPIVTE